MDVTIYIIHSPIVSFLFHLVNLRCRRYTIVEISMSIKDSSFKESNKVIKSSSPLGCCNICAELYEHDNKIRDMPVAGLRKKRASIQDRNAHTVTLRE